MRDGRCITLLLQLAGRILLVFMFLTLLRFEMSVMQVRREISDISSSMSPIYRLSRTWWGLS